MSQSEQPITLETVDKKPLAVQLCKEKKPKVTFIHSKNKKNIENWLKLNIDEKSTSYLNLINGCWKGYCKESTIGVMENFSDFTVSEKKLKNFLKKKTLNQIISIDYNTISSMPELITKKVPNEFEWKIICSKNPPEDIHYENSKENWNKFFNEVIDLN